MKTRLQSLSFVKPGIFAATMFLMVALLVCSASVVPAYATSENISGEVSQYLRQYNTQRFRRPYVTVSFTNGQLHDGICTYRNWDNPDYWATDIVKLPYDTWSLGLRRSSDNLQFTRLEFRGAKGSGYFIIKPPTFSAYFKINTKGSYCESPQVMPFTGTLNY